MNLPQDPALIPIPNTCSGSEETNHAEKPEKANKPSRSGRTMSISPEK
jgi:hypothetical protein